MIVYIQIYVLNAELRNLADFYGILRTSSLKDPSHMYVNYMDKLNHVICPVVNWAVAFNSGAFKALYFKWAPCSYPLR